MKAMRDWLVCGICEWWAQLGKDPPGHDCPDTQKNRE